MVTQIAFPAPAGAPSAVNTPLFDLEVAGSPVQPGSSARAFILHTDERFLTDLGQPTLDRVDARGIAPGDQLCVVEPAAERQGCVRATTTGRLLTLQPMAGWQPELNVTPVTSRTITVSITGLLQGPPSLLARLYPNNAPAPAAVSLTRAGASYLGALDLSSLEEPVFEGMLRVWDPISGREAVVDYSLGGNPGKRRSVTAPRSSPGKRRSVTAPVLSGDGQALIYSREPFAEGQFYAIQSAASLPKVPAGRTPVGQGYRITASASAPELQDASISIAYLQRNVPEGLEAHLQIYFLPDGGTWTRLPTTPDAYYNQLAAPMRGPGLYTIFAAVELPLGQLGYNVVSYPLQGVRPVEAALSSITGQYRQIYGYNAAGATSTERWPVYAPTAPAWVNTLRELAFGQVYFIYATEVTTLYVSTGANQLSETLTPPSTLYGEVRPGNGFTPAPGMPVIATMGARVCGEGVTDLVAGRVVYLVAVVADTAGCGAPGQIISFWIGGAAMAGSTSWDNSTVRQLNLQPVPADAAGNWLYLPFIHK